MIRSVSQVLIGRRPAAGRSYCAGKAAVSEPTALERFMVDKIRVSGPITVAEYMKTAIASSSVGYYGRHSEENKVFGASGDFITAPELTQLFGEMLGIWCYYELANTGHRGAWQLVECGPGTGQLSVDLLRVMHKFGEKNVSLHLVETSDALIDAQEKLLCGNRKVGIEQSGNWIRANKTKEGDIPVYWYKSVDDIPEAFTVFVANEFLDALPVHQFERSEGSDKWYERYIGLDGKGRLRFVRSPGENIHTRGLLPEEIRSDGNRRAWEISPEAGTFVNQVAERITSHGGFCLLVDYGHDGSRKELSLRAYSKHEQVDVLTRPGEVDLTADVNFGYLKTLIEDRTVIYGPNTQREFLGQLGIEVRLRRLIKECPDRPTAENLIKGYNMLMGEMGQRFLAMSIFPKTLSTILDKRGGPVGFATGKAPVEEKKDAP